jgi:hypothetical protein
MLDLAAARHITATAKVRIAKEYEARKTEFFLARKKKHDDALTCLHSAIVDACEKGITSTCLPWDNSMFCDDASWNDSYLLSQLLLQELQELGFTTDVNMEHGDGGDSYQLITISWE